MQRGGAFMFIYVKCFTLLLWKRFFMDNTMLIQVTNQKALGLLHELQELHLIKVLKENYTPVKRKLSDKYKGIITKEQGDDLKEHINQMRSEWNSI